MAEEKRKISPFRGKSYTLFGDESVSGHYYRIIGDIADKLLKDNRDEKSLLLVLRKMHEKKFLKTSSDPEVLFIRKILKKNLSPYTLDVKKHLKGLSFRGRFDETLRTKEEEYHLYMLEIELSNRINKGPFKAARYRFALLPHCLRDFRPKCCAVPGEIEVVCKGCTKDCFANLGSTLLRRYGIDPYISVEMDQEKLFSSLKKVHPSIGALGVACVPELANGMRLCDKLGIPAIGIPLDANRCRRWMGKARETSFNLEELEKLLN